MTSTIVANCFNKCFSKESDWTIFKAELDESQNQLSHDEFVNQFLHCMQRLLLLSINNNKSNDIVQFFDTVVDYLSSNKMIAVENCGNIIDDNDSSYFALENGYFSKALLAIVEALLAHHNSECKQVRQNVCYLLDKLFQRIPPKLMRLLISTTNINPSSTSLLNNTTLTPTNSNQSLLEPSKNSVELAVKLCQKIKQYLVVRLSDKITVVRIAAIRALRWFQNASDVNCTVVAAFINSLQYDLCVDVRLAVLECLQLSNHTITHLLQRINDCKEEVRSKALSIISENVSIKMFSIHDRIRLVKHILVINGNTTQKNFISLLKKWSEDCDQSLCQLISYLDPETYNDTVDQLFNYLFTSNHNSLNAGNAIIDRNRVIDEIKSLLDIDTKFLKVISVDASFLWNAVVKYQDYFSNDFDHIGDHVLPELTPFCKHLSDYIDSKLLLQPQISTASTCLGDVIFNIKKLIGITMMMDLSDEIGRQTAYGLYVNILGCKELPLELIPDVVGAIIHFSVSTTPTIENVIEIISDHLNPLSTTAADHPLQQPPSLPHTSAMSNDSFKSANSSLDSSDENKINAPNEGNPFEKKSSDELQLELANVRFELMTLKNDIDEAISRQDFYSAAEMKTKFDQIDLLKHTIIEQLSKVNQSFRDNVQAIKDAIVTPQNSVHNDDPNESMTTQLENRALNDEDDDLKLDDPGVVIRCLIINSELLKQLKLRELTSSQQTLFHSLILPSIQNVDPLVRNEAVLNLGLYSIRSKEIARKYLLLMLQILQMDCESVQLTAISASFDVILAFGTKFLDEKNPDDVNNLDDVTDVVDQDGNEVDDADEPKTTNNNYNDQLDTINSMLNILLNFLDSDSCNVHNLIASGMAKLLLLDRIRSSELLSKLILVWHNPNNSTNEILRKTLGMFFPIFAGSSKKNQELFDDAALPTLKAIYNAPDMSPLSDIKINIVVEFFVELTSPRYQIKTNAKEFSDVNLHDSLAFKILNDTLCDDSDDDWIRILSKFLTQLHISTQNETSIKSLKLLFEKVSDKVSDKVARRYLDKFEVFVDNLFLKLHPNDQHSLNDSQVTLPNSANIDKDNTQTDSIIMTPTRTKSSSKRLSKKNSPAIKTEQLSSSTSKDLSALTLTEQKVDKVSLRSTCCETDALPKPKLNPKQKKTQKKSTKSKKTPQKSPRPLAKKLPKTTIISTDSELHETGDTLQKNCLTECITATSSFPDKFDVTVQLDGSFSSLLSSKSLDDNSLGGKPVESKPKRLSAKRSIKPTTNKKSKMSSAGRKKKLTKANHRLSASEKAAATPDLKRHR